MFGIRPDPLPKYNAPLFRLSREDARQVILMRYRDCMSISEVAEKLGICKNTVLGVQRRLAARKSIPIEKIRAIFRYKRETDLSDQAIADVLEISRSTVEKYLQFEQPIAERRYVRAIENL